MAFSWLIGWLGGKPKAPKHCLRIQVFSRQGCHLCEVAWQHLEHARHTYPFELSAVDVDSDPQLVEKYGLEVPVVAINEQVRFRGEVNPVLLNRLLRAEAGRGDPS